MKKFFLLVCSCTLISTQSLADIACIREANGNYLCSGGARKAPPRGNANIGADANTTQGGNFPGAVGATPGGTGATPSTPGINSMPSNCPGTPNTLVETYYSGNKKLGPLVAGQNFAVAIPVSAQMHGRLIRTSIVETAQSESGADVQFSVSTCPGDFSKTMPCSAHTQYTGGSLMYSIGPKPKDTLWYMNVCELPAGTRTVYFNFRHIKRPTPTPPGAPGVPSCMGQCTNFVQVN